MIAYTYALAHMLATILPPGEYVARREAGQVVRYTRRKNGSVWMNHVGHCRKQIAQTPVSSLDAIRVVKALDVMGDRRLAKRVRQIVGEIDARLYDSILVPSNFLAPIDKTCCLDERLRKGVPSWYRTYYQRIPTRWSLGGCRLSLRAKGPRVCGTIVYDSMPRCGYLEGACLTS